MTGMKYKRYLVFILYSCIPEDNKQKDYFSIGFWYGDHQSFDNPV